MSKVQSTLLIAGLAATALMTAPVAGAAPHPIPIQAHANALSVGPMPGFTHGTFTVRMRGAGIVYEKAFAPQEGFSYGLLTDAGALLGDGRYVFEVWVAGSAGGTQKLSGSFEILGGTISTETLDVDVKQDIVDVPILGDAIVEGSICVSDSTDCLLDLIILESESFDTPGFGAADVKIKDNVPEIWFADTTAEDGDFALTVEDSRFFLRDPDADTLPFVVESGTPSNGIYITQSGRIGVGTSVPSTGADLTLANIDGSGTTRWAIHNAAAGPNWMYAHSPAGNFLISKSGTGGNEFTVRERFHSLATLDVEGHVRGTSFKSSSSRALKTGFETVDSAGILDSVASLPISSWRFKSEAKTARHVGPVAEDFQNAFGLGDGKSIATVDADGVLFAAVQALNSKVQALNSALEVQLQKRNEEIAELRRINIQLEERLRALEGQPQESRR